MAPSSTLTRLVVHFHMWRGRGVTPIGCAGRGQERGRNALVTSGCEVVFAAKVVVVPMAGDDDDVRSEAVEHRLDVFRRRVDEELNGDVVGDGFEKHRALLVEPEIAIRPQADVHDIDAGIALAVRLQQLELPGRDDCPACR